MWIKQNKNIFGLSLCFLLIIAYFIFPLLFYKNFHLVWSSLYLFIVACILYNCYYLLKPVKFKEPNYSTGEILKMIWDNSLKVYIVVIGFFSAAYVFMSFVSLIYKTNYEYDYRVSFICVILLLIAYYISKHINSNND